MTVRDTLEIATDVESIEQNKPSTTSAPASKLATALGARLP